MTDTPAIRLRDIVKSFGPVQANRGAELEVARGEIHALVGENGAGKSTLVGIITGLLRPDEGNLRLDGKPVEFRNPLMARAAGSPPCTRIRICSYICPWRRTSSPVSTRPDSVRSTVNA